MSPPLIPLSPSFVSLSTAAASSTESDDVPLTPKVRFDQECILIPDPVPVSRIPRLVTKSYSLPLWKRKRSPSVVSDSEDELLEDHVVFKVSVPSITTKARSPSRGEAARPLVPCLVQPADPSSSIISASPSRPAARPRGSSVTAPVNPDAITVPLRACCAQCYPSIDKCMKAGEHWEVRFSRGALRRRKSLSDAHSPSRTRHCLRDAMPGFDAFVAVDEVDQQRRRSTEMDTLTAFTIELPATASVSTSSGTEEVPLRRALSLPDAVHPSRAKVIPDLHPCVLSPPIMEEDEHRPSPRRTPISSPLGSSTHLPSTCIVHAVHTAPTETVGAAAATTPTPSPENSLIDLDLDRMFSSSPITLTPPVPIPELKAVSSYFSTQHFGHNASGISLDSPASSPSSSPRVGHARSTSTLDLPSGRKKPLMALPGSLFRASTQVLKGLSSVSGVSMSA